MRAVIRVRAAMCLGLVLAACSDDETDPSGLDGGAGLDAAHPHDTGTSSREASTISMDSATARIDRSHLRNTGTTTALDYADPALWVCRPGNDPNECHANLDATEIHKDGTRTVVPHVRASDPKFDCFYVYPTVALSGGGNMTDFSDIRPVLDPLLSQGARFSSLCEVYAPLYRQVSLSTGDAGTVATGDSTLAVRDVVAAFDYYLAHHNRGRNFVVLGHSQGTGMAISLLQQRIDGDAALRGQLISAVLLGAAPRVPEGQRVGGSFQNIPVCQTAGETGCILAYVTYDVAAPPNPTNARFGRTTDAGQVACSEPGQLTGKTAPYTGSYFRLAVNNPTFAAPGYRPTDLTTPFMIYRDYFKGQCVRRDGFSYLELSLAQLPGDTREVPPYRSPNLEQGGWGLHLVDYNVALEDLIKAVELQAAAKLSG